MTEDKYVSIIFNSKNHWLPPEIFPTIVKEKNYMWSRSRFPLFVRSVCCFVKQLNLTRKKEKKEETLRVEGFFNENNCLASCRSPLIVVRHY